MRDPIPHAAFVAPDPAALAPLFPGYDIEGLIASGGMGSVYQAVQRSLERPVAIKILSQEFSQDAAFRTIFEAEAKAMAKLNHPNLIGVYDFGEVSGMLYIIMEFVPGQSLFHSAHGMAVDPSEVIRLVSGICHGLAHAHENGVIHRDIKPSNILLDLEARPKIGDFGLARNTGQTIQEGEEIFGTPHYTAPEVVNAPQTVDHRADIFSLGVLLHELLTGRLPADDPRPPSVIIRCSPRFDAIVRRATDEMPSRRYNSALEIAKDLQAIVTTSGPKAAPKSSNAPKIIHTGQRQKKPQSAAKESPVSALILLIVIGLVGFLMFRHYKNSKTIEANRVMEERMAKRQDLPLSIPQAVPEPEQELNQIRPDNEQPIIVKPPEPETNPDPEPEPEIKPKFDVADFLDNRARKIMRERSATLIKAKETELAKNLTGYERSLMSEARKEGRTILRDVYTESIKTFVEECKEDGNSIPEDLPEDFENLNGASIWHSEYLQKQEAIDEKLLRDLSSLADTYILGLDKQIERLRETDDPVAIKMLQKEIDTVHDNEEYFPELMLEN